MKILLADDMKAFLDLERSFLSRAECELYTAATGLEALKLATRLHPDLILLDIEMPEMTGIEACRLLKANPVTAKIPVVIITATDRREESARAGADGFAQKPIDERAFLELVRQHTALKERVDLRIPFAARVTLSGPAGQFETTSRDLSASGMALQASGEPPALGDQLTARFSITLPEGPQTVNAQAVVVRHLPGEGAFAIRFFDMTSGTALTLQDYFALHVR